MVLHVFISFLGGVPLCIPYGLYSGTSLSGTTWEILEGFPGRVSSTDARFRGSEASLLGYFRNGPQGIALSDINDH